MNSSIRNSSITSVSVMTSVPTTTAIRSSNTAQAAETKRIPKQNVRILKRLSNRKEELKMADMLDRRRRRVEQQLLICAFQSVKRRRIDAIGEVQPNGADRGLITDPKTGGVHHIIEVRQIILMDPERNRAETGVNISHVVKQHTLNVVSHERKTQFGGME